MDAATGAAQLVSTIYPNTSMVAMEGVLFYDADWASGPELIRSDGTSTGTYLVKDIYPGSNSSSPSRFTPVGSTLFFIANNGVNGTELWKSDGTEAGTVLVKDINPGSSSSSPDNLTNVNGTLYFTALDPTHGRELWKSDGTEAGTVLVKDILPGASSSSAPTLLDVRRRPALLHRKRRCQWHRTLEK